MERLVKRSQQVLSLKETIERVNNSLLSLTQELKDIALKGESGELTPDQMRHELTQIQAQYAKLKKQKDILLNKYKELQQNEKRKQNIGENGLIEFYNLVLSYRLPRKDGSSPIFIKIYEVPQMYMTESTKSARVRRWVVAISGVQPSDSENYFVSKKPLQKMQNVHHTSDETNYHSISREVAQMIDDYTKPLGLATQSISIQQQLPAFSNTELTSIKKEVEKVISQAANQEEDETEEMETRVEPEMKEKPQPKEEPKAKPNQSTPFNHPKAPGYNFPNNK